VSHPFVPLDPESQIGYQLVRTAEELARSWSAALREHGINPRQFSMLALLAHDPRVSQAEIGRRVMITPQSVGESLANLLENGWISRSAGRIGRAATLGLTPAGRRLLARAYPVVEAHQEKVFSVLTKAERAQLMRMLQTLTAPRSPAVGRGAPSLRRQPVRDMP
jgi:DNA-binding MarR family transcriptional regulator